MESILTIGSLLVVTITIVARVFERDNCGVPRSVHCWLRWLARVTHILPSSQAWLSSGWRCVCSAFFFPAVVIGTATATSSSSGAESSATIWSPRRNWKADAVRGTSRGFIVSPRRRVL
jgi:hypothetical protein